MAITIRYSTNSALQYNEIDLTEYLVSVGASGKKFLTKAPLQRILNEIESSALAFIGDNDGLDHYSARYRFYDANGTILNEHLVSLLSSNVHNSLPISTTAFYQPEGTVKLTIAIITTANLFKNPDLSQGSGNTFTHWTLTQPNRTNIRTYSEDYTNGGYNKFNTTIVANSTTSPFGTLTADSVYETAVNSAHRLEFSNSFISGNEYSVSHYVKKGNRDYFYILFFDDNGVFVSSTAFFNLATGAVGSVSAGITAFIEDAGNGWYRCIAKRTALATATGFIGLGISDSNGNVSAYLGDITKFLYYGGTQVEIGDATPYIFTTTTAVSTTLGEITQSTTGGIEGSRCLKLWVNTGGATFHQGVNQVDGVTYTIRFKARVDVVYPNAYVTGASDSVLINSTEWKTYSMQYVAIGTGNNDFYFDYSNDYDYGFVYLDDIEIFKTSYSLVTEERSFVYDFNCYNQKNEITWINKLGGQDTFVFTGLPIKEKTIERDKAIEYPMNGNFTAPNPIYQNRKIISSETMTLFTRCENEETARWLRDEIFDSIATYLRVGSEYYPILPQAPSVQVYNENGFNYQVTFKFNFAFDVNIQTI